MASSSFMNLMAIRLVICVMIVKMQLIAGGCSSVGQSARLWIWMSGVQVPSPTLDQVKKYYFGVTLSADRLPLNTRKGS
jgi:hypothetical protein